MITCQRIIKAPYPIDFLFHIAQDVENYAKFLPHCIGARILDKSNPLWRVQNVYRWGPITQKFITLADVQPNTYLHIQTDPKERLKLNVRWDFEIVNEQECNVTFQMGFASPLPVLEKMVSSMIEKIAEDTERAFLRRAADLSKEVQT